MKAMKKTMALLLAVVMALSLAGMAFATDPNATWNGTDYGDGNTNSFDATATVTKSDGTVDETAVYCVDIAWTVTPAEYTSASDTYIWSPSDMKYVRDTTKIGNTLTQSSDSRVYITVTNKSNADVAYAVSYVSAKNSSEVAISEETVLGRTWDVLVSAAPETVTLTGSPTTNPEDGTATTNSYTADVALAKDDNGKYIATKATAGTLTLGTYTVTIKKPITINYVMVPFGTVTYDVEYLALEGLTFYDWWSTASMDVSAMGVEANAPTEATHDIVNGTYDFYIYGDKTSYTSQGELYWDTVLTDGMIFGYYNND